DDEVPPRVHRGRGEVMLPDVRAVDDELAGYGAPAARETPGDDAGEAGSRPAVLVLPGDEEVAVGVHRNRGVSLEAGHGGADLELQALRRAAGCEAPRIDGR